MKYFGFILSYFVPSLLVSVTSGQDFNPELNCGNVKQAQCTAFTSLAVDKISKLQFPPTFDNMNDSLQYAHSHLYECKHCISESQTEDICNAFDDYVNEASGYTSTIDIEFDVEKCKKDAFFNESIEDIPSNTLGDNGKMTSDGANQSNVVSRGGETKDRLRGKTEINPVPVNPIKNGCVNMDFDIKLIGHLGTICVSGDISNPRLVLKGEFVLFGNVVARYYEVYDRNREVCLNAINMMGTQVGPCIRADFSAKKVIYCFKFKVCYFIGCSTSSQCVSHAFP